MVSIPVGVGGSTRSAVNLLTYLEGAARRVVVGPPGGRVVDLIEARGAADEYLPYVAPGGRLRLGRVAAALRTTWWVARNRRSVRAVHANGLAELNLAILSALVLRVPVVVWVHQTMLPRALRRAGRLWRWVLPRAPVRWAAVSDYAADLVADPGLVRRADVVIVPNPIDPADVLAPVRQPAPGEIRAAYVGTPARYKGFDLLPALIEDVSARLGEQPGGPMVRWLVFSGQSGDEAAGTWERLRAMAATHGVSIEGKTADAAAIYARCDVVVCPSRQESFCRVAAEAMLNGIPVVASDLGPVRQVLGDDVAGLLVPPEDVAAAGEAVVRLVRDAGLRRRLGAAGRERAGAYAPGFVRDRFLELFGLDPVPAEAERAAAVPSCSGPRAERATTPGGVG